MSCSSDIYFKTLSMFGTLRVTHTSGFDYTNSHQQNVRRRRLTQCPSSVANTSFPSLIFPETWLTLSLLPRNGCRTDGRERRSQEREGEAGKEERQGKALEKGRRKEGQIEPRTQFISCS